MDTETDWIYAVVGSKESEHGTTFCRFNIRENDWKVLPYNPSWLGEGSDDGSSLVWAGGDYLYAFQGEWDETDGSANRSFARFDLTENTWQDLPPIPEKDGIGDGGSLVWTEAPDSIYGIGGGSADEEPVENFYKFNILGGAWKQLSDLPYGITDQNGPRLGYVDGKIYCWRGYYAAANGDPGSLWAYETAAVVQESVELQAGWNLFSLSLQPENSLAGKVFSEMPQFPTIYGWSEYGYEIITSSTSMEVGKGYWVYIEESENVTITGSPVNDLTLHLDAGWNLAGLPSGVLPRTPENIWLEVPTIYGWSAYGYNLLNANQNFEAGQGYWIYSEQAENVPIP